MTGLEAGLVTSNTSAVIQSQKFGRMEVGPAPGGHPLLQLAPVAHAAVWPTYGRQVATRHSLSNLMATTFTLVGDAANNKHTLIRNIWVSYLIYEAFCFRNMKVESTFVESRSKKCSYRLLET